MYSFDYKLFKRLNPFVKNKDIAEYLEVSEGYVSKVINGQTQLSEEKFTKLIEHPDWDVAPLLGRAQATTPTYPYPCNLVPTQKPFNIPTLTDTDTPTNDGAEVIEAEVVELPIVPTSVVRQPETRLSKWLDKYSDEVERLRLSEIIHNASMVREVKEKDMCPTLKVGQYIYLELMPKDTPIKNGRVYFVDHSKLGGFFRRLYDRGEQIEGRADNRAYEPNFYNKADIYDIYQVVGVFSTDIIDDMETISKDKQIAYLTEQNAHHEINTQNLIDQTNKLVAQQTKLIEALVEKK